MRINYIETYNRFRDLKINRIDFKDLNLLVGISGAGKTQIIKSILDIKNIAQGKSINGFEWKIEFSTVENNTFLWEGAFCTENTEDQNLNVLPSDSEQNYNIEYEKVYKNNVQIIDRSKSKIIFNDIETVKLPSEESIISVLKEEKDLSDIFIAFTKILYSDHSGANSSAIRIYPNKVYEACESISTLEAVKNSNIPVYIKLYYFFTKKSSIFDAIKQRLIEVFPQIEDLRFVTLRDSDNIFNKVPFIQIKETGVQRWISQNHISSGMFRSLMQIAELYLSAKGTVILIDEFENSLGINCIDELTEDLLENNSAEMQFIVTSHHPYIINNISPEYWKIVTRKAGQINTQNANELNIESSHHDAFLQLINFEEYQNGIES